MSARAIAQHAHKAPISQHTQLASASAAIAQLPLGQPMHSTGHCVSAIVAVAVAARTYGHRCDTRSYSNNI